MKKIVLALILLTVATQIKAQGHLDMAPFAFEREKMATQELVCLMSGVKEIDDNVKWTMDKFWKNSKTSYESFTADFKLDPSKTYFQIRDVNPGTAVISSRNFFSSTMIVQVAIDGMYKNSTFRSVNISFDNIRSRKKPDEIIGADKTISAIADKSISYIMMMCANLKNFPMTKYPEGNYTSIRMDKEIKKLFIPYLQRLKTTTVLVPKELIDNGITEAAFAGLKIKYKIEPLAQITQRIKSGKDVKNYSQLLVIKKNNEEAVAYIVDIENGDMIYYGWVAAGDLKPLNDKLVAKLLKDTNEYFEE